MDRTRKLHALWKYVVDTMTMPHNRVLLDRLGNKNINIDTLRSVSITEGNTTYRYATVKNIARYLKEATIVFPVKKKPYSYLLDPEVAERFLPEFVRQLTEIGWGRAEEFHNPL